MEMLIPIFIAVIAIYGIIWLVVTNKKSNGFLRKSTTNLV